MLRVWERIIANEPSERRRSDGEAGAQDWAIGRKILDRAEKKCNLM